MTVVTKYDVLGNVEGYWDEEVGQWVPSPALSDPLDEEEEEEEETE